MDSDLISVRTLDRVLLILSAITTVAMLGWVLWYCLYGFDFSDEAFYLVWISNPFIYSVSVTQFGYIYHPLYLLVDGSIAALRQVNMLLTFSLAWIFFAAFLKKLSGSRTPKGIALITISAVLASSSLIRMYTWLPTPSYNSLAMQALLICATGLMLTSKQVQSDSLVGWFLVGLGGWLAFMAKPTTAAALGFCTLLYMLAAGSLNIRLLLISALTAVALLAISAFWIDGSITGFIERLSAGVEISQILDSGYYSTYMFRLDSFSLHSALAVLLVAGVLLVAIAIYGSLSERFYLNASAALMSTLIGVTGLLIVLGIITDHLDIGRYQSLLIWIPPVAAVVAGLAANRLQALSRVTRVQWALAAYLAALPHVFAFGSGNNYWIQGSIAGMFWVASGLVLLDSLQAGKKLLTALIPTALATQLVTIILVQSYNDNPYRQPLALRKQDYPLEIGRAGSKLILSPGYGRYIENAMNAAKRAHFKPGTPVIDLTGHSPGILFALGAENIGQAWTIGGYPGSDELAADMLSRVSCEDLASAWLLTEFGGPREISADILSKFGANIAVDFEVAGSFPTAVGAGSYQEVQLQELLKPVRPWESAISACEDTKLGNQ